MAAIVGALSASCAAPTLNAPELTDVLVALTALAAMVLAFAVGHHVRRPAPHRWDRHIALNLPMLAPERYCACGRCFQLAAPGAVLADWHYAVDAHDLIPPIDAPDAIPIRGIAWSYGPNGWDPAIVYVVGRVIEDPTAPPTVPPPRPPPSSNGQATGKLPSR